MLQLRKYSVIYGIFHYLVAFVMLTEAADYSGYKMYEAGPFNQSSQGLLPKLLGMRYDVLDASKNTLRFLVSPEQTDDFDKIIFREDVSSELILDDVGHAIKEEKLKNDFARQRTKFNFDRFPRYQEIVEFMQEIVNGSKYAQIVKIGDSFEGRPILGIRLQSSAENPVIFVDAGIHAREWAAPITAMYIIKRIVESEDIFARDATIYVIPAANPDGYEYTHIEDRFWRKSRSTSNRTNCIGVDINRNFDSYWGVFGVSRSPCGHTFPGFGPFTEPEAVAIANAILTVRPTMYLTFHSYGPLLLYPWGFTKELPLNWEELDSLGRNATAALKKVNGQDYIVGSSTNVLYRASGGSDDWAMQKGLVSLVYTIELPHYGSGFVVPEEKIIPMVNETFAAFQVFFDYVTSKRKLGN